MKFLLEDKRCIIQAFELDDNIFYIDDRASMLYFHIGVVFDKEMVYMGVKYFFDKKEIRFSFSREPLKEEWKAFVKRHIHEIISTILGFESDYNKGVLLSVGDIVLVKKTFSLAKVTGVYASKAYFELDHDIDVDYSRAELVKWANAIDEERENLRYKELDNLNLVLDKVECLGATSYEVIEELHDGGVHTHAFKVYDRKFELMHERACAFFDETVERWGNS